jgi:hypothetical protein
VRRAFVVCAAVLASCMATRNWAQDAVPPLRPGEIVQVGKDTYEIREPPTEIAQTRAKQKASEHCKKMNKVMVIKDGTFDLGDGLVLTFSCVPPVSVQPASSH